jgi:hypothetical protein
MYSNSSLSQTATTVVFIDASVSDYQTLQTGVIAGVETVILSPNQNGIEEITDFLRQHTQITTIHIVSHGSPGCLYLGNSQLNLDNISKYADLLQHWQSQSILLYGCNVAAGDGGEEFIHKLHQITKATISASTTKTGNAALGGNWELEVNIPENNGTSLVFCGETLATYQGVFAIKQFGTSSDDNVRGIITDSNGNFYVTGQTSGSLPGNTNLGGSDAFITKYDALGNQVWTKQFGSSADDNGFGITIDNNGNLYITGQTAGSLPGQTNKGQSDAFIAKYDTLGNQLWIRQFGSSQFSGAGNENTNTNGISIDINGNIYITGGVFGGDAYIVKYDTSGTQLGTKRLGASNGKGNGIITDGNGNFYTTGNAVGNLSGNTNQGLADAYIAKYDALGNQLWAKLLGTSASDFSNGISRDNNGNLYIVGNTSGSLLGNTSQGAQDAYIAKYDALGNQIWVKQFGTSSSEVANGITINSNGTIYVTGSTNGSLPGNTNQGSSDAFIAAFDSNGNLLTSNQAPTNLTLSNSTVAENQVIGTVIGNLSSTDPDTGNTFTYSLVTGTGATDNSLFSIINNQLTTNSVFDYETKNSYSVRVRTTDQGGLFFEQQLTIGVTDLRGCLKSFEGSKFMPVAVP